MNLEVPRNARRGLGAAAALAVLALWIGGCGESGGELPRDQTLRVAYQTFPDHLDPALAFSAEGITAMYDTYIPLLTYAHADGEAGSKVIPGLAKSLPKISDGGKTYTLFLRHSLRYSNGVPVRASDFTHSVERVFRVNSSASAFYTDIVGAERFAKTKRGGIPGIETDDRSGRIVIHLVEPHGTFSNELALLFVAPLPPDTPNEDLTRDPPPATGPYMISGSQPGRGWEYRRNPEWLANNARLLPHLPSGHVDRIDVTVVRNPETEVNDIEQGRFDWMQNPPPADRLPELRAKYAGSQLRMTPLINDYYFWMNTKRPPFNDLRVRRAVNYAIDPAALERIYAGQLRGMQQILPRDMPGHRTFELYPHNMAKARALIRAADPADRDVTVWTDSSSPNDEAGEYYQGVLKELGFDATLKIVDPNSYFTLISNTSTPNLDTGWTNWFEDFPHPNDYFGTQLSAESIQPVGNTNWAQFDDPAISAEIKRLGRQQLGPRQEAEYAALDRAVMKQAPWAPFGTLTLATFVSDEIDLPHLVTSPIYGADLTSFEFKSAATG